VIARVSNMSERLETYIRLECEYAAVDHQSEDVADKLDALWYAMTDEERDFLNARTGESR
jgi:hypothetical protein